MKLEILMSCMNQKNMNVLNKSNVKSSALIVNQTKKEGNHEIITGGKLWRMIDSKTKGLSISRNLLLKNAKGDICLISDDDEIFKDNMEELILEAFKDLPQADVIAFKIENHPKRLPEKVCRIKKLQTLRISSIQIAFRRESILKSKIFFDEKIGAGTYYGSGEENKFLFDCLNKGLKIYYVPRVIASLDSTDSSWFAGFDDAYFIKKSAVARYYMGFVFSFLYGIYFAITKYPIYKNSNTRRNVIRLWINEWHKNELLEGNPK